MTEEARDEFLIGDELATAGDRVALEYGWWADAWISRESERAGERKGPHTGEPGKKTYPDSRADSSSRAAFTYALDTLQARHGRYLSRAQLTDRIRIGRAFPRATYEDLIEELHYKFTFSQLRAAFVRDDEKLTMELLLWAAENDAEPININARKMGSETETDESKAWRHLVEWADKYVFRGAGKNKQRHTVALGVLEQDRDERRSDAEGL